MYFTPENARRVDAVRETIREWRQREWLTDVEHAVLLHDLMSAANKVANTTGTYGFYLTHWSKVALQPFELKPKEFLDGHTEHTVILGDAIETATKVAAPIYYLDPPYTKRQYAAYYHLLETFAYEDEPPLIGKTGSRGWKHKASDFCHKLRAPKTMKRLLESIDAKYVFVSYSEDGHIPHVQMMDLLNVRGDVKHIELNNSRYLSNGSEKGTALKERLYKVTTR
jgi:adenine-specific DNA-methyltransferase